jgi:prolyl-tRNA synthetase
VCQKSQEEAIRVLFDGRDYSPGVKFNDANLLGISLRLTLSQRTLQSQSIEAKWHWKKEAQLLPSKNLAAEVNGLVGERLAQ